MADRCATCAFRSGTPASACGRTKLKLRWEPFVKASAPPLKGARANRRGVGRLPGSSWTPWISLKSGGARPLGPPRPPRSAGGDR